jgi:hypothetical protein
MGQNARMTAGQFREALREFGLTQVAAGRFFGVDLRSARRWLHADVAVPVSVAKLLRVMQCMRLTPEQVDAMSKSRSRDRSAKPPQRQT